MHTLDKARQQVVELQTALSSTSRADESKAPETDRPEIPETDQLESARANGSESERLDAPKASNAHARVDSVLSATQEADKAPAVSQQTQEALIASHETETAPTAFVEVPFPHPHDMEEKVQPEPGEAVAAEEVTAEAEETRKEMTNVTPGEAQTLMNVE